jgi:hypothetical protein
MRFALARVARSGVIPKPLLARYAETTLRGVNMTDSTRPLKKKLLTLPVPQDDDVETQLLIWIRGVVQSNHELVGVMKRLRHSYKTLLAGKSVIDAEEILWRVEVALMDTERSKNVLASGTLRGS